ncbi:hypothetical protein KNJ79_08080 [Sphingopyxis indica]|uniref:hypothetical protein n=1 Tax=Sphingopyxis indica TaxID=436663 RepID=UPI00293946BF|nr:hypothetical protein [Sphingopyxis indica]WOF44832.1 hypothetical protein KNJ79_08080 [Sphingopyxis indica]
MPDDARDRGMVSIIGWATAIVIATGFIIGAFAGYSDAIAIRGGTPLPVWLGPLVALAFCGAAFTLYARHHRANWRQWSARKRRYGLAIALLALIGGIVGAWFSVQLPHDQGPFEAMRADAFSPAFAIGASILWVVGLAAGMFFYHRAIDDHEQRAWLWAGLAGWYAFVFPAPAWWALHRAGIAPEPDVMLLFLVSLVVNSLVYLWLKFR